MNKFVLTIVALLFLSFTVQGAVAYNSQGILNNLVSYYSFDTNATDVSKTVDLMNVSNGTGGTSVLETKGTPIIGQAVLHAPTASTDANNLINFSKMPRIAGAATFAVSGWFRFNLSSGANQDAVYMGDVGTDYFFMSYNTNGSFKCAVTTTVGGRTIAYGTLISIGTLTHYVCVYNGVNITIWKNGVHDGSAAKTGTFTFPTSDDVYTGGFASGSQIFNGSIDELGFWNASLNHTQVALLYNGGAGLPFCSTNFAVCTSTPPPPGANETLTINVYDMVTGGFVTGLCLLATGTNTTQSKCNSTGSSVSFDTIGTYTLSLYSIGKGDNLSQTYYNVSQSGYVFTTTETLTVNVTQAYLNVTAQRLFLNTSIASFNVTNGLFWNQTTGGSVIVPATNGSNNIQLKVLGNITQNYTCSAVGLAITSCTATNVHDTRYSFNATDIWNNLALDNFSLVLSNASLGGVLYNRSTTNGSLNLSLLQGYTYFIQFTTPNGSYEQRNVSLPANATNHHYTFGVLPAPSINITIRDAETNALITENVTIQLINNVSGETNYTISGGFFSGTITVGTYTVKLESDNYSQSIYTLTISTGEVYYLTAYLQFAPETVIMQFVDSVSSSVVLPNTAVSQERIINGSWQVISSKVTDITGRTSFRYADDVGYRFTAVLSGYSSKLFTLDPILFDSYTINMVRNTSLDFEEDFQSVYVGYTPQIFYNGQENAMNITFASPTGTFTSYNYSIRYPGGIKNGSGTNIVGQTFNETINISGATFRDRVNITLTYQSSIGEPRQFNYSNGIIVSPGNTTFIANQDNTYGLGLMERLLIGTIIIVIVAGLITLGGGSLMGLMIGLFLMGFWIYLGFWPWWSAGLSFLVGFALLAGRSD